MNVFFLSHTSVNNTYRGRPLPGMFFMRLRGMAVGSTFLDPYGSERVGGGGGVLDTMHDRSRVTMDSRIPTMRGRLGRGGGLRTHCHAWP